MSGYAQVTLRRHSAMQWLTARPAEARVCMHTTDVPIDRLTDRLFLCAHITRKRFDRFRLVKHCWKDLATDYAVGPCFQNIEPAEDVTLSYGYMCNFCMHYFWIACNSCRIAHVTIALDKVVDLLEHHRRLKKAKFCYLSGYCSVHWSDNFAIFLIKHSPAWWTINKKLSSKSPGPLNVFWHKKSRWQHRRCFSLLSCRNNACLTKIENSSMPYLMKSTCMLHGICPSFG